MGTSLIIMDSKFNLSHIIFLYLIVQLKMSSINRNNENYMNIGNIAVTSWNMNCTFNSSGPYIEKLLKCNDFVFLSEHGLYNCELWKFDRLSQLHEFSAKSSKNLNDANFGTLPGHGGCAFMWTKKIDMSVKPLPDKGTDRMIVMEIKLANGCKLYVIGVYLPYYGCKIANPEFEMSVLEDLIFEYKNKGNVILIGDTNCHINIGTNRSWGTTSINGKSLMKIMNRCDMIMVDMQDSTRGPTYTFCSGNRKSYIDHCAIDIDAYNIVKSVEVLDDEILNVSDHLALRVELEALPLESQETNTVFSDKVAWHKVPIEDIKTLYTDPLEEHTYALLVDNGIDPQHILSNQGYDSNITGFDTEFFTQLFTSTILCASSRLPKLKRNKGLKPYWDSSLNCLSKQSKKARSEWIKGGRPRDSDSQLYIKYKDAKRQFRKAQRQKRL